MSDAVAQFHAALGAYSGYVIGAAALATVLPLNQLTFRHRWKSFPTLAHTRRPTRTAFGPRTLSATAAGRKPREPA